MQPSTPGAGPRVLVVVTSTVASPGGGRKLGLCLAQLGQIHDTFAGHGWEVTFASPVGGRAPIDPATLSEKQFAHVRHVDRTVAIDTVAAGDFDAYLAIGGHGALWDLPKSAALGQLLAGAYAAGQPVAAVAHGTAALVAMRKFGQGDLLSRCRVTGPSNAEETLLGRGWAVPFSLEDELRASCRSYSARPPWEPYSILDGHLVTGQNAQSAAMVAEVVVSLAPARAGVA